jgi:LuxR family maltose regulon positive regulatory protein
MTERAGLSPRELAVLRCLPTSMTGSDIADSLFVSINTVRTHIKHIYEKLGVHTRSAAVDAARRQGLLAPPRFQDTG